MQPRHRCGTRTTRESRSPPLLNPRGAGRCRRCARHTGLDHQSTKFAHCSPIATHPHTTSREASVGLQTASRERACHERFVSSYKRTKTLTIYLDMGLLALEVRSRDERGVGRWAFSFFPGAGHGRICRTMFYIEARPDDFCTKEGRINMCPPCPHTLRMLRVPKARHGRLRAKCMSVGG